MMTNWPTAEIMLMGSWEKIVVGVGGDTYTIECQWHGVETARDDSTSATKCNPQETELSLSVKWS